MTVEPEALQASVQALENRIHKQTRRRRIWVTLLVIYLIYLAVGNRPIISSMAFVPRNSAWKQQGLFGYGPDKTLGLSLRDDNGMVRFSVVLDDMGSPRLEMRDETGKVRFGLGFKPSGDPALAMMDGKGSARLSLAFDDQGHPAVVLRDRESRARVTAGFTPTGMPSIGVVDEEEKSRGVLSIDEGQAPMMQVCDKTLNNCASLAIILDSPAILLEDGKSKASASMYVSQGNPGVRMLDRSGTKRLFFGLTASDAPTVLLSDSQGRVRLGLAQEANKNAQMLFLDEDQHEITQRP